MKPAKSKFRPTGSKKSVPLTREQFDYILDEFHDRGDARMEVLCHLLYRAIRIGDCLKTIKAGDVYNTDGTLKAKITFTEEKTGKLRNVPIAGERFINALTRHWAFVSNLYLDDGLFFGAKTGAPL